MAIRLAISNLVNRTRSIEDAEYEFGERVPVQTGDRIELRGIDLITVKMWESGGDLVVLFPNDEYLIFTGFIGLQDEENPPVFIDEQGNIIEEVQLAIGELTQARAESELFSEGSTQTGNIDDQVGDGDGLNQGDFRLGSEGDVPIDDGDLNNPDDGDDGDGGGDQPPLQNDPPVIHDLNADRLDFIEDQPPQIIDQGDIAFVTDPDSPNFNGGFLEVSIISNLVATEDVLGINTAGNVSLSGADVLVDGVIVGVITSDGTAGNPLIISFNGQATPARVGSLIDAVTYQNTNFALPDESTRVVRFTVNDGDGGADSVETTVTVTEVNDRPEIDLNGGAAGIDHADTFTEDDPPVAIGDPALTVTDIDDPNLDAATITLTNPEAGDRLVVDAGSLPAGIGVNMALSSDTMIVLTGNAASADYQTALTLASFENTSQDPVGGDRIIDVTVTDKRGLDSLPASSTITVVPVNDAPEVSVPGTQSVDEDSSVLLNGISVADADAGTDTIQVTLSAANGILILSDTTGLTVTGNGTGNVLLEGTLADINAALSLADNVLYEPDADFNGTESITVSADDLGNNGTGGPLTDTESFAVPAITVSDADVNEGTGEVEITLSVDNGTLTLGTVTGLAFTGGTSNGEATLIFTGSLADVNAALATVGYDPASDFNGADSLHVEVNDLGNTGAPGAFTDTGDIAIDVTAVNDAPALSLPGAQTMNEDGSLAVPPINISDADVDEGTGQVRVTLSVDNGTLDLGTVSGLSFIGGTANGDATLVVEGSLADINTALGTLSYDPDANFNGSDTIQVEVTDLGNAGAPGALTDSGSISVNVTAINDAPTLSVPGAQTVSEDATETIPGLSVDDVDAAEGTGELSVTLAVTSGTLNMDVSSLSVKSGANNTNTITVQGTVADLNAALAGLTYTGNTDFSGSDQLSITVNDLGNTGLPGAQMTNDTVDITVVAGNDAPTITLPAPVTIDEDTQDSITGIIIDDPDAGTDTVRVTLAVNDGVLDLNEAGVSVIGGAKGTNTITIEGNLSAINAALGSLTYQGTLNFDGSDTLTITANDLGNNGAGGAQITSDTLAITVSAVNDGPVMTVPGAVDANEAENTAIAGVSFNDVDVGGGIMTATITALSGTVDLDTTGVSVTAGATGSATVTVEGTLSALNTAIGTLTYTGNPGFSGADDLTISLNDNGNTGSGGAKSDDKTIVINVNDAPDAEADKTLIVAENSAGQALNIPAPVDSDNTDAELTVMVLSVPDPSKGDVRDGLTTVNAGDTLTVAQLMALTYVPVLNETGPAGEFVYEVNDPDGASDTQAVTFNIAASAGLTAAVADTEVTEGDVNIAILGNDFIDSGVMNLVTGATTEGGDGADTLNGGAGQDAITGGGGMDILSGDGGDDFIFGGADADTLSGGLGNDHLVGGRGGDTLTGGPGTDRLVGGEGSDTFVFDGADVGTPDTIGGFDNADASEKVDLSAVFGGGFTPGPGTNADHINLVEAGGSTTVQVDPTGTGSFAGNDLFVLEGVTGLTLDTFVSDHVIV